MFFLVKNEVRILVEDCYVCVCMCVFLGIYVYICVCVVGVESG